MHSNNEDEKIPIIASNELSPLILTLTTKRRIFLEKSRMYCCGLFSFCMLLLLILFYIFDIVKYNSTCKNKSNSSQASKTLDICEIIPISLLTKIIIISLIVTLLLFGLYCSGSTVITLDAKNDVIEINKKKLFCLPNVIQYKLRNLTSCSIEGDFALNGNNVNSATLSTSLFQFHSLVLHFKHQTQSEVNIGFGRDCFIREAKEEIKNKINDYIIAYSYIVNRK